MYFNAGIGENSSNDIESIALNFQRAFEVNFLSVVKAISELRDNIVDKYVYISSMSTILPGVNAVGYALSKYSTELYFKELNKLSQNTLFQLIIIGPVKTDFNSEMLKNSSFIKKIIFNKIAINKLDCAKFIIKIGFCDRDIIYYPFHSLLVFKLLKFFRLIRLQSRSFFPPG